MISFLFPFLIGELEIINRSSSSLKVLTAYCKISLVTFVLNSSRCANRAVASAKFMILVVRISSALTDFDDGTQQPNKGSNDKESRNAFSSYRKAILEMLSNSLPEMTAEKCVNFVLVPFLLIMVAQSQLVTLLAVCISLSSIYGFQLFPLHPTKGLVQKTNYALSEPKNESPRRKLILIQKGFANGIYSVQIALDDFPIILRCIDIFRKVYKQKKIPAGFVVPEVDDWPKELHGFR